VVELAIQSGTLTRMKAVGYRLPESETPCRTRRTFKARQGDGVCLVGCELRRYQCGTIQRIVFSLGKQWIFSGRAGSRELGGLNDDEDIVVVAAMLKTTALTDVHGQAVDLGAGVSWVIHQARRTHGVGCKLIFLGIGADAGSASHMAIDFCKNGGVRALSMTDPAAITCLGNDIGFENVFAKQLEFHARSGDLVIIIGGSGTAPVLLNGAHAARKLGLELVTITTSPADNPLRALGNLNFNIAADPGILATITQLALCHSFVDFLCEWTPPAGIGNAVGNAEHVSHSR